MSIRLREVRDVDEGAWDSFVNRHSQATFFHLSPWRRVIEDVFGHKAHYLLAEQDGDIVGVLPLARMKTRLFGDALISTPFCVYGGPLTTSPEADAALERYALDLLARLGSSSVELRNLHAPWMNWGVRESLYYTFRKPITGVADADMKAIPRKQRAMVRKAVQLGLKSTANSDIRALYRVYAESVRNLGTPVFSKKYFEYISHAFPGMFDVMIVHEGEEAVAAVLNFYFRDEVLPYYGGGTRRARQVAANDFMYWEVMRRAGSERGCRLFDFGRSKINTGAFDFKKNWGFSPAPLHYCYRLRPGAKLAENNPNNPKYRLLISAWRHLPLPVANLLGPPIVRGLG